MKQKFLLIALFSFTLIWTTAKANETEPNNTKAQANTLALNGSNSGKINPAADQDWWKVTTTGDGKLDVTLSPLSGKYTWVYLYDNDGVTQLTANYSTGTFTISADGLAAGTYYLKVICFYTTDTSSYNISNTLTVPAQANDAEPDSTRAQALVLPLNGSKTGHVGYYYNNHRDSVDWYKVTTNGDGLLRISLTPADGQYTWAYLYDNNGTTLLNSAYSTGAFSFSTDGLEAGTYYVRVNCYYSTGFAPYTLSDSLFKPSQANDLEPDSTRALALTLPQNGSTTGHVGYYYKNHRDSADWYKITTNADGQIRISLTPANGKYTWAYLYDNNGTTLLNSAYSTGAFSFSTDGLAAGTYYVRVNCYYTTDFAPYTLSDSLFTYANANDAEPNGKPYQAKTMPANGTVTGHSGFYYNNQRDSADWYKINYTGSGALTVTANFESTKSAGYKYTYLQIWKDTLASPIYSNYTASASLVASLTSLTQGYYWVRIITYYNTDFESYSLTATFTQVNIAKIKLATPVLPTDCSSTNSLKFTCSQSQPPYTVQLYRFGVPYGSPVVVAKTKTFTNLPDGYYYATAYGDGATGTAFGTSKSITLVPKPTNTSTTNITSTQAKFNWTTQSCASYYSIQYRVHGTTTWTRKKTNGNVGSYTAKNLTPATLYEWSVASADTSNGLGSVGAYTDSLPFTTAASFAGIAGSDNDISIARAGNSNAVLTVYPNPVRTQFTLQLNAKTEALVNLSLKNMNGNIVWSALNINANTFSSKTVDVSNLANGLYILQVTGANSKIIATQKIVIEK